MRGCGVVLVSLRQGSSGSCSSFLMAGVDLWEVSVCFEVIADICSWDRPSYTKPWTTQYWGAASKYSINNKVVLNYRTTDEGHCRELLQCSGSLRGLKMIPGICGKWEKCLVSFIWSKTYKRCIGLEGEVMNLAFIIKNKMSSEYQIWY